MRIPRRPAAALVIILFSASFIGVLDIDGSGIDFPSAGSNPHSVIDIDGNADLLNTASSEGWPGSGSQQDPILISNYTIDAGGSSFCIAIANTTYSISVQNCTLKNSKDNGIFISNSMDISIANCVIDVGPVGIYAERCGRGPQITATMIKAQAVGIYILNSYLTDIDGCNITNSYWKGIWIEESEGTSICRTSSIDYCQWGFHLLDCNNSLISESWVNDTGVGFQIDNCSNLTTFGNDITGDPEEVTGTGVSIKDSKYVMMELDSISYHDFGMELTDSHDLELQSGQILDCGYGIKANGIANCAIVLFTLRPEWSGMEIQYSENMVVYDTEINGAYPSGIAILESGRITLSEVSILSDLYGLEVSFSDDVLIELSNIRSSSRSLDIFHGNNIQVKNSVFRSYFADALYVHWSDKVSFDSNFFNSDSEYDLLFHYKNENITLIGNTLYGKGLAFEDFQYHQYRSLDPLLSTLAMKDNIFRDKPIEFYKNIDLENAEISPDTNQIIMYQSSNIQFSDMTMYPADAPFFIFDCENIRMSGIDVVSSACGIAALYSHNIELASSDLRGCDNGVWTKYCGGFVIEGTDFYNNGEAVESISTVDLRISSCKFSELSIFGDGIRLTDCSRVRIESNTFDDLWPSLYAWEGGDILVEGNDFTCGLSGAPGFHNVDGVILKDNTMNSAGTGSAFDYCHDVRIMNNTIDADNSGLFITNAEDTLVITGNEITGSQTGIDIIDSSFLEMEWNLIRECNKAVRLKYVDNGRIDHNLILESHREAILVEWGKNNQFFENSFIWNNGTDYYPIPQVWQVKDLGRYTSWNTSSRGNYWSNVEGSDSDFDGIVDYTVYSLPERWSADHFPLTHSPYPLVSEPRNIKCFSGATRIELRWEEPLKSLTGKIYQYHIYRGSSPERLEFLNAVDRTSTEYSDTEVIGGFRYYYGIRATNAYGEGELSKIVSGFKDDSKPELRILTPKSGSWVNTSDVLITWEGEDLESGMDHYEIRIDDGQWTSVGLSTGHSKKKMSEGSHTVWVRGVNNVSMVSEVNTVFEIDHTDPILHLSGSNPLYVNLNFIRISWNGEDQRSGIKGYRVRIRDDNWSTLFSEPSYDLWIEGQYTTLHIRAEDLAGNSAEGNMDIVFDIQPPGLIFASPDIWEVNLINTTEIELSWEFADALSGIHHFRVKTSKADLILEPYIDRVLVGGLTEGPNIIELMAYDRAGNVRTLEITIYVDTTVPEVISHSPSGVLVAINAPIVLEVSESLQEESILIEVFDGEGVRWWGNGSKFDYSIGPSGTLKILVDFVDNFDYGQDYTVRFRAFDLAGNQIPTYTWEFATLYLGAISGIVKDNRGRPVQGAEVALSNGAGTVTGPDGSFSIEAPPGVYTVTIRKNGYDMMEFVVTVEAGRTVEMDVISMTKKEGSGSSILIVAIAAVPILLTIIAVVLILVIIKRRRSSVTKEAFYVVVEEPPPKVRWENFEEDAEFEIEYFDQNRDYYTLLGVDRHATSQEIRAAYRKMASLYHPDRMAARGEDMELDEIADLMREINDAKTVLLNPVRRQMYDMSLLDDEISEQT
ncbi:MAG: NosD domain-containing protein [Thermoplasmatota archaeon]